MSGRIAVLLLGLAFLLTVSMTVSAEAIPDSLRIRESAWRDLGLTDTDELIEVFGVAINRLFEEYDSLEDIMRRRGYDVFVVRSADGTWSCFREEYDQQEDDYYYARYEIGDLGVAIPLSRTQLTDLSHEISLCIGMDTQIINTHVLSGAARAEGTVIYYTTNKGDWVYFTHISVGELLFPKDTFLAFIRHTRRQFSRSGGYSGVFDLSFYNFRADTFCPDAPLSAAKGVGAEETWEALSQQDSLQISGGVLKQLALAETDQVVRIYPCNINGAFREEDRIEEVLTRQWIHNEIIVVQAADGSFSCWMDEYEHGYYPYEMDDLSRARPLSREQLTAFADEMAGYIGQDTIVRKVYVLSGDSRFEGDAICLVTNKGDYVHFADRSVGKLLFPAEAFFAFMKAWAVTPNTHRYEGVWDLSFYDYQSDSFDLHTPIQEVPTGEQENSNGELWAGLTAALCLGVVAVAIVTWRRKM